MNAALGQLDGLQVLASLARADIRRKVFCGATDNYDGLTRTCNPG